MAKVLEKRYFCVIPRRFPSILKFERQYLKRCWINRNITIKPKWKTYGSLQSLSDPNLLILSPFLSRLVYITCKFKDVVIQLSVIISSLWSSTLPHPHKTLKLHKRTHTHTHTHTHTRTHKQRSLGFCRVASIVVQSLTCVWLFATPWSQAFLSFTISRSLLKLTCTESVMASNHLILFHPLLLLPSIFPSMRVLSNESVLRIRWPKCWSFTFSISPSNEYSGLISFRIDWFVSLQSKGFSRVFSNTTAEKHLFFSTQPSLRFYSRIHTWLQEKTIALTRRNFVSK